MTLWYFSRSHSMKTESFDFTEVRFLRLYSTRAVLIFRQDWETLVEVLISLMFAEDRDLAFDPNIALASHTNRQYIYTVNSESGPRRFKTTHSIFETRALSVAGRMTRVFRVVELEGQTNEPKKGVKPMVLKDVWLDEGSETEMEIQKKLFADIEKFAEQPKWREAPSLAGFVDEEYAGNMSAFAELLQGERYKDLFLVVRDGSTGEALLMLFKQSFKTETLTILTNAQERNLDDHVSIWVQVARTTSFQHKLFSFFPSVLRLDK